VSPTNRAITPTICPAFSPISFRAAKAIPFLYESTGVETFFSAMSAIPSTRSRRVFSFHRPETLAALAAGARYALRPPATMPGAHPLPVQNLRACQVEGITYLEESFAAAHPRALIQMATGAGKTYTACAFTYRSSSTPGLGASVPRRPGHLGRQALAEFQQFVTPDTGRKFTELYNVQHLTSRQTRLRRARHHLYHPAALLDPPRRAA